MAYMLNKKIRDLKPYDPIQGNYEIRLDANESFFNIPEVIKAEVLDEIGRMNFNRYPDPLAKDVAESFANYYGLESDNVTVFNGSDESIFVIMSAFLMKGDKVITLSNDFSMYKFYATLSEGEVIELKKNEDLTIDVDELIKTANENNVQMLIFSNPCNPTSIGLEAESIRRIIRSVNALVVLDEAYMDFWDQSLINEASDYDNVILLKTCSKAFGMASLRLGFTVANKELTTALRAVKSPYNSSVFTQKVGKIVYNHGDLMRKQMSQIIDSRINLQNKLKKLLENNDDFIIYQSCTNFVYIKTKYARAIYEFMLEESIAIRCFAPVQLSDGHLRITAGTAEENEAVIAALEKYLKGSEC